MKEEWKQIMSSTWIKIVLAAIVVIPMLYAGIFLGSMWDPYGNADKIPVAVVNEDHTVSYNGSKLHIGDDLVSNLKKAKEMDFQFVDTKQAEQGLKHGSYYMIITIPTNFSANATTLLEEQPKKMELKYTTKLCRMVYWHIQTALHLFRRELSSCEAGYAPWIAKALCW